MSTRKQSVVDSAILSLPEWKDSHRAGGTASTSSETNILFDDNDETLMAKCEKSLPLVSGDSGSREISGSIASSSQWQIANLSTSNTKHVMIRSSWAKQGGQTSFLRFADDLYATSATAIQLCVSGASCEAHASVAGEGLLGNKAEDALLNTTKCETAIPQEVILVPENDKITMNKDGVLVSSGDSSYLSTPSLSKNSSFMEGSASDSKVDMLDQKDVPIISSISKARIDSHHESTTVSQMQVTSPRYVSSTTSSWSPSSTSRGSPVSTASRKSHSSTSSRKSQSSVSSRKSLSSASSRKSLSSASSALSAASSSREGSVESAQTYSTILESDDSSVDSIITQSTISFIECFPSTSRRNNDANSVDTNFTLKSLKMKKRFEAREREIRRLSLNNRSYSMYLRSQEDFVQRQAENNLAYLRRRSTILHSNRSRNTGSSSLNEEVLWEQINSNSTSSVKEPSIMNTQKTTLSQAARRAFLFERFHTLPGVFAFFLYVIAHTSCYEFFYHAHNAVFYSVENSWDIVYLGTFIVGILLLRLTGGLFMWTSDETYEGAKFDMHNKIRLRDLDARIMKWIRKKRTLRIIIDIFSVYMCFISMGYMVSEKMLPAVCDIRQDVYDGLPSHKYGVQTYVHELLQSEQEYRKQPAFVNDIHEELATCIQKDQCIADLDDSDVDDLKEALEELDAEYLHKSVSRHSFYGLYGWERTPIVSQRCYQSFHFVTSVGSMVTLFQMGVGFWDE